jgi:hypothetical protein
LEKKAKFKVQSAKFKLTDSMGTMPCQSEDRSADDATAEKRQLNARELPIKGSEPPGRLLKMQ